MMPPRVLASGPKPCGGNKGPSAPLEKPLYYRVRLDTALSLSLRESMSGKFTLWVRVKL